ncbi:ABC transporter permease [Paenibacillus oenotherae]|uniref:ABC transporter permease n=1 Tax=Paenibacillus oenotherae TaxID=1435645 RepID=A0ABS7D6E6_9BACL|nr:ABC transporter permease [Paenibacillus oenotherae]MBW7475406.1 ABC transporter permease [Paenibacillus oenotherae]
MVNLLYTELLKLKRAKMLLVSLIGASAAPLMVFIGFLDLKVKKPDSAVHYEEVFYNTNLYVLLLIGTLLYGVITAYIFNREHEEDTLKNLLTIPVSRTGLIVSKLVLLFFWIMLLTIAAWALTLALGLIGQFEGLSAGVLLTSFKQFIIGGSLLFLLSTPTMFITFLFRNYVPTIIFTAAITMGNVALANREYKALNPWSAVQVIANYEPVPQYPLYYSYIAILLVAAAGFLATVIYFRRLDIQ